MPIDMLPDDVLLKIFDFCSLDIDQWLNLQLVCSIETPTREMLDVWPPLPLLIYADESETSGVDNVVAALERSNRVREISISISRSRSEELWKAMEEPHPELTFLKLESNNEDEPVSILPDSFLGGSAPRLESIMFRFRDYPNYFCRPLTSPSFPFRLFLLPDTFHPSRWSQAFPH
jgi:hypothetical protein